MANKKSGRNRKRYWNDVHALERYFGIPTSEARKLWKKTVDELGQGKRSKLSRETFTHKAKKTKKKAQTGEEYFGVCGFMELDGHMTDAIRRGFEMRFEFGPWWTSNTTTPQDEAEAMDLRREMREAGDSHFGGGSDGNVKTSSDSWRIKDFIHVFCNAEQKYYRFKWGGGKGA